jgi:hypothetical protein
MRQSAFNTLRAIKIEQIESLAGRHGRRGRGAALELPQISDRRRRLAGALLVVGLPPVEPGPDTSDRDRARIIPGDSRPPIGDKLAGTIGMIE